MVKQAVLTAFFWFLIYKVELYSLCRILGGRGVVDRKAGLVFLPIQKPLGKKRGWRGESKICVLGGISAVGKSSEQAISPTHVLGCCGLTELSCVFPVCSAFNLAVVFILLANITCLGPDYPVYA